ncbi:MAG: exodeoxyribonuclease VII large subunit [Candidatus Aminicenantes bacterium]|nr:exodeoxyribonuclease VII large subunit [Candidatus Aminicenantes bacterium]
MPEGLVERERVYSVSEVTELVKAALEVAFPQVLVEGEVSGYKRAASGHVFFTLKDEKVSLNSPVLKAVMWQSHARKVAFEMKDGLKVICRGKISVYEPRGDYQLYVDLVEPKGKGALQLAFEQLKAKLKAEGLFEPGRKKKLPLRPRTIGVVTSPTGAAVRDILRVLERRYAKLRVLIYPAKVQGEGAAREIAEGLDHLGARPEIDVIIVGRGGGSIEDLWAFNEEAVARAIARSPKPVISAVGHEIDFTIADFVADVRASTPSAAAEMVIEKEEAFQERIDSLARRAAELLRYDLQERRSGVADLARHRIFQNFRIRLLNLGQRLDDLDGRARNVVRAERQGLAEMKGRALLQAEKLVHLVRAKQRDREGAWERLSAALNALSPLAVLKKGYALVWRDGGLRLVRKVEELAAGETVIVSFYKGEFQAQVRGVDRKKLLESRFLKESS